MATTNFMRAGIRMPLELPVEVRWKGPRGKRQHAQGKTVTISGNGFYVILPARLPQATAIQFAVDLPVELTRVPMKLTGQGHVVRGSASNAEGGIGAIIDDYRLLLKAPEV